MRQAMGLTMMFVLIVAVVFMSASLLMPRQIISLFLPRGESFDRAVEYLSVVALGYLVYRGGQRLRPPPSRRRKRPTCPCCPALRAS